MTSTVAAAEGDEPVADVGRLARGGALNFIGAISYGLCGFALVIVISASLGATGTGEVLLAIAAFNIVQRLCELGSSTGLVRSISVALAQDRPADVPRTLAVALVPVALNGVVAAVALYAVAGALGELVADGSSADAVASHLRVLAPLLPVATAYSVVTSGSRGFGTMRIQALVDKIGRAVVQVAAVGLVVAVDDDPGSSVLLAWAVPFALAAVPAAVLVRREVRRARAGGDAVAPAPWRPLAARFWSFSLPRALSQLFQVTVLWFDTLLIGALRSAEEAGVYAAGTRYLLLGTFTSDAVMQVLGPQVSGHLVRRDVPGAQRLYDAATTWQVCLVWPAYLLIAAFPPALLGVFGDEFTAASTALTILACGVLVASALGPADVVVLMAGRSRLSLLDSAVVLALNIGGNLLLTPRYGIEGAAVAWSVAIVATAALPAYQLRGATGVVPLRQRPRFAAVAAFLAAGVPCLVVRALLGGDGAGLAVAVAVTAPVVAVVGWRLRDRLGLDELVAGLRQRGRRPAV